MKRFIDRALDKVDKIGKKQLVILLKALAQDYQLLESVYDSMTDGVIVLDSNNQIEYINKSAERLVPIDSKNSANIPVWKVLHDREISIFLKNVINNQENARDREFAIGSSNSRKFISISIMPLVNNGNIRGTIIHLEDITQKREQSVRLGRAERLASLTTLTASVAHEIKNPLAAISIHIQLIQKSMKTKSCDQQFISKHLEVVNDEVERLNGTIVDFLFAVRPMNLELEECEINHLLSDIIELVDVELKEANIVYKLSCTDRLPKILVDEKYIKQAFLNIIKNAMAAMSSVVNPTLLLDSYLEGQYVCIKFKDNGCGISESDMEKIFEPYFTTKDFGSGLGLTVVYKVIQEHGGELIVDSDERGGSSFIVKLPLLETRKKLLCCDNEAGV